MWLKYFIALTLVSIVYVRTAEAQSYEDKRCKCICPSTKSVKNASLVEDDEDRILIIDNVPPNKCNCDGVILPRVGDKIKGKEQEFCPRCECKYENRNTTIIKVVVIIVIWIISLLVVYMLFLMCLDPLLNKRVKANYQEHTNEDDDTAIGTINIDQTAANTSGGLGVPLGVRGNVLNRVGHQQDKWKRQVKEQRKNIYDRHTMLN